MKHDPIVKDLHEEDGYIKFKYLWSGVVIDEV